jgi:hypothetical protein
MHINVQLTTSVQLSTSLKSKTQEWELIVDVVLRKEVKKYRELPMRIENVIAEAQE